MFSLPPDCVLTLSLLEKENDIQNQTKTSIDSDVMADAKNKYVPGLAKDERGQVPVE
jgi:hypothetical protein